MSVSRSAFLFLAFLLLGLSVTLPAPDVCETAYDESEALPFEATPLISLVTPLARGSPTRFTLRNFQRTSAVPARARRIRIPKLRADASTSRRVTLTLLCALHC